MERSLRNDRIPVSLESTSVNVETPMVYVSCATASPMIISALSSLYQKQLCQDRPNSCQPHWLILGMQVCLQKESQGELS